MIWKRSVSGRCGSFVASPKSHVSVPRQAYVRDRSSGAFAAGNAAPLPRSEPMRVSTVIIAFDGSVNDGRSISQRAVFFTPVPPAVRFVVNAFGDAPSGRFSTGDGMYSSPYNRRLGTSPPAAHAVPVVVAHGVFSGEL